MQQIIHPPRQETARLGEDTAARYLTLQGMEILERNARFRQGELDIVARDGSVVVFVEVKTRWTSRYGEPQEAVHSRKQARLRMAAAAWLVARKVRDVTCRFDVVAVHMGRRSEDGEPLIIHLPGAFS